MDGLKLEVNSDYNIQIKPNKSNNTFIIHLLNSSDEIIGTTFTSLKNINSSIEKMSNGKVQLTKDQLDGLKSELDIKEESLKMSIISKALSKFEDVNKKYNFEGDKCDKDFETDNYDRECDKINTKSMKRKMVDKSEDSDERSDIVLRLDALEAKLDQLLQKLDGSDEESDADTDELNPDNMEGKTESYEDDEEDSELSSLSKSLDLDEPEVADEESNPEFDELNQQLDLIQDEDDLDNPSDLLSDLDNIDHDNLITGNRDSSKNPGLLATSGNIEPTADMPISTDELLDQIIDELPGAEDSEVKLNTGSEPVTVQVEPNPDSLDDAKNANSISGLIEDSNDLLNDEVSIDDNEVVDDELADPSEEPMDNPIDDPMEDPTDNPDEEEEDDLMKEVDNVEEVDDTDVTLTTKALKDLLKDK